MFRVRNLIEFESSNRKSQISAKISDFEQKWKSRISQKEFHLFVRDEINRSRCVCKDRKKKKKRTNKVWNNWQFRIQLKSVLRACFELEIIDSFALNWDLFFTHTSCSKSNRIRIFKQKKSNLDEDIRLRTRVKKSNFAEKISSICSWRD